MQTIQQGKVDPQSFLEGTETRSILAAALLKAIPQKPHDFARTDLLISSSTASFQL